MILVVDAGNTRVKSAVFEEFNLIEIFIFEQNFFLKKISSILKLYPKITHLVLSSVINLDKKLLLELKKHLPIHIISHENIFPFLNSYQTPKTLGLDRLVLAAGATLQFPKQNRLIIDAGTCVTYDFIDEYDVYHGGGISPGLSLRYKSLNDYTENLPLLQLKNPTNFIGNSTSESIHSGIVNGLAYEIDGFIDTYKSKYVKFILILTGGDAIFLANRLKNTIFANSNFLLESLAQIFQYQTKND